MDRQYSLKAIMSRLLCVVILGGFLLPLAHSRSQNGMDEPEALPAKQAFSLTAYMIMDKSLGQNVFKLKFSIAPGYFLYREHFKFRTVEGSEPIENLENIFPTPQVKHDEVLGDLLVYTKQLALKVPVPAPKKNDGSGIRVQYQGCSDSGFCYPPITKLIEFNSMGSIVIEDVPADKFDKADITDTTAALTPSPVQISTPIVESESDFLTNQLKTGAFPLTFLIFLGLGILLSFTPCVLPMVPILANILVGQDTPLSSRRAMLLASTYVLSVAICYAVLGVCAGLMGSYLQVAMQKPMVLVGMSFLLLLFALSQLSVVHIQLPQFFTNALHQIQYNQKQGSMFGAMAMGVISALVVSPCVTPALVGALSYIGQTGNAIFGGLALFALALGMGLPLLVVACIGSRYLPKAGSWMTYIKGITGILLLALAGVFFMRAFPEQQVPTSIAKSSPKHFISVQSRAELLKALETAKAAGKHVILDVYADWCVSCKQIDNEVFANHTVISNLRNTQLLRLDMTNQTSDIQQLQKELGIVGPPTLLFFGTNGKENKNYRLVGKIGSTDFIKHISHFFTSQKR